MGTFDRLSHLVPSSLRRISGFRAVGAYPEPILVPPCFWRYSASLWVLGSRDAPRPGAQDDDEGNLISRGAALDRPRRGWTAHHDGASFRPLARGSCKGRGRPCRPRASRMAGGYERRLPRPPEAVLDDGPPSLRSPAALCRGSGRIPGRAEGDLGQLEVAPPLSGPIHPGRAQPPHRVHLLNAAES